MTSAESLVPLVQIISISVDRTPTWNCKIVLNRFAFVCHTPLFQSKRFFKFVKFWFKYNCYCWCLTCFRRKFVFRMYTLMRDMITNKLKVFRKHLLHHIWESKSIFSKGAPCTLKKLSFWWNLLKHEYRSIRVHFFKLIRKRKFF